jgi:hypothetical protein
LREYGYTEAWRNLRGLENDPRIRGVIAQELYEVFPEHIEILPELAIGDVKFENFHQVDKQGLVLDCKHGSWQFRVYFTLTYSDIPI